MSEDRGRMSEVRGQRLNVGSQMLDDRIQDIEMSDLREKIEKYEKIMQLLKIWKFPSFIFKSSFSSILIVLFFSH